MPTAPVLPIANTALVITPSSTANTRPTTRPRSAISTSSFDGESLEGLPVPEFELPLTTGLEVIITAFETGRPVPDAELMVVDFGFIDPDIWTRRNLDRRDPEEVVRSVSRRYRSGKDGRAFIPWPRELTVLLVRAKGLSAAHRINTDESGPVTVEVAPDTEVKVRVLDVAGMPVPDCPVDFRVFNESDGFDFVRARTDHDGMAISKNIDRYALLFNFDRRGEARLGFPVANKDASTAPFSFVPLPVDPLELRAPATGRVVVEVQDGHGGLVPMDGFVRLRVKDAASDLPRGGKGKARKLREGVREGADQRGRIVSGTAEFTHVEVGLRVQAEAWFPDGSAARGEDDNGPLAENDSVVLPLIRPISTPTLVMKVVDPERRPLSNQRIEVAAMVGNPPIRGKWVRRIMTDVDGILRTDLGDPEAFPWDPPQKPTGPPDPIVRLLLTSRIGQVPDLKGQLDLPATIPDPYEPGELMLSRGEVLLTGLVTDEAESPVRHARLLLERQKLGEDGKLRWQGEEVLGNLADYEGKFVVRSMDISGVWRVRPERSGYMDTPWTEFRPGAALKLILQRGCKVVGNVLLDPELPAGALRVRLVIRKQGAAEKDPPIFDATRNPGVLGEFEWDRLPEGVARLSIHTAAMARRSLFSIEGVVLRPGPACDDPRLKDIDLRGKLRRIVVTLRDPGGNPVDGEATIISKSGDEQPTVGGNSRIVLLAPPETVDLRVTNARFSTVVIEDVVADTQVRFRPARVIRFQAPSGIEWPNTPDRLGINVEFLGHPDVVKLYGRPRLVESPRGNDQVFGSDGEAIFRVTTPARLRVRWFVERPGPGGKLKQIRVGGQPEDILMRESDDEVTLLLKPPERRALTQAKAELDR